jgi:hypothetical protein
VFTADMNRIRFKPGMMLRNAALVSDEPPDVIRGRNDLIFDLAFQGHVEGIRLIVEAESREILVDSPIDLVRFPDGTLKAVRGDP